jgi:hypothetical protein
MTMIMTTRLRAQTAPVARLANILASTRT